MARYTRAIRYTYQVHLAPLSIAPLLAFVVAVTLHVLAVKMFPRWKLMDFPERYGLKRPRLPYPTGILAVLTFLLFFAFLRPLHMQEFGLMAAVIALAVTSFADDRLQLSPAVRLCVQGLAALLIVATGSCVGGRICSVTNPLEGVVGGEIIELNGAFPVLSIAVTVLWLLLTMNALNWFDGIPGQVSLLSVIGFLTIGFLSLSTRINQPDLALLAFVLAAIAAACFFFDFPPAKVVLGDSGSMFFGLMLGTLTIYAGGKVATAFLVLGVPLIDSVIVIIRRILTGRSPLKGSSSGDHLHHRLLAKGWSERSVILLTAGLGMLFGVTALFLNTVEKFIAALVLAFIMLALTWYSRPTKAR